MKQRKGIIVCITIIIGICMLLSLYAPGIVYAEKNEISPNELKTMQLQLAAMTLAKQAIIELGNAQLQSAKLVKKMNKEMNRAVQTYKKKEESRNTLKKWVTNQMEDELKTELKQIAKTINSKMKSSLDDRWPETIFKEHEDKIDSTIELNLKKNYDESFDKARKNVVYEQYRTLNKRTYPSPEDVELIYEDPTREESIIDQIKKKLVKKTLFLENENRYSDLIRKNIKDAKSQRKGQEDLLMKSEASDKVDLEEISMQLKDELRKFIDDTETARLYQLFPSVEKKIPERAQFLMQRKFKSYLKETTPLFLTDKLIAQESNDHSQVPPEFDLHLEALVEHFCDPIAAKLTVEYQQKTGPDVNRKKFGERLNNMLTGDLAVCYKNLLEKRIRKPLSTLRDRLSDTQIEMLYPTVWSWKWAIPEHKIIECDQARRRALNIGELPNEKGIEEDLLEETRKKLLKRGQELLKEGLNTMHGQINSIVDAKRNWIIQKIDQEPNVEEKEWIKRFTSQVQEEWSKKRIELIWPTEEDRRGRFTEKYVYLFDATKKRMREIITREFEKNKQPMPTEKIEVATDANIKGKGPGGGGSGSGSGSGGGGGSGGGSGGGLGPGGGGGDDDCEDCLPILTTDQLIKELLKRGEKGKISKDLFNILKFMKP